MRILIDTNVLIPAVLFPNSTVQKRVKNIIHRVPIATYQYIAEKNDVSCATVARARKWL